MGIVKDFKKFALRGNVADMAIGFTVGAAFTTVVRSLVDDIIMPPIAWAMGGADFTDRFVVLKYGKEGDPPYRTLQEAEAAGAITLDYGQFVNAFIALLLVAIAMFVLIRVANRIDEELDERFAGETPPPEEPADKKCPYCRTAIPFRAVRCPNCTSQLEGASAAASQV
jgi:large conductance mechanosensitive channel